mgnify:CR=1 FL=1
MLGRRAEPRRQVPDIDLLPQMYAPGRRLPFPPSTRVPTRILTMCVRKPSPETESVTRSPRRVMAMARILRTVVLRAFAPAVWAKARKSWRPTRIFAARRMAGRLRGAGTCQARS